MNRIQITEHFHLDEFIDPRIYAARGQNSIQLLDMRIVLAAEFIRSELSVSLTINNWATGGQFRESGLRRFDTGTGAKFSQHKFGRAVDIKSSRLTPKQIHEFILANEKMFVERQWITTLEDHRDTPTWTHIDCRYTGLDRILIVRP